MEKKNFVNVNINDLITAQDALYQAQKGIVAQLLGTEEYGYREIDNLLHRLQSNLQIYERGRVDDLGWAWGENYDRKIDRLETLIAAVTPVHNLIARACCGHFEDDTCEPCGGTGCRICTGQCEDCGDAGPHWSGLCPSCKDKDKCSCPICEDAKAISVHMQEVDHAFWAENKGRTLSDVVDANCKGDWDDNDIPF